MKNLLIPLLIFSFFYCSAQTPTKTNIEKAVMSSWEKAASSSSPRQFCTIHSVEIGSGAKANEQDRIDGIPPNKTVTIAQVDFTVREFYNDRTIATHRVITAKVFKDQFEEWVLKAMNESN